MVVDGGEKVLGDAPLVVDEEAEMVRSWKEGDGNCVCIGGGRSDRRRSVLVNFKKTD